MLSPQVGQGHSGIPQIAPPVAAGCVTARAPYLLSATCRQVLDDLELHPTCGRYMSRLCHKETERVVVAVHHRE